MPLKTEKYVTTRDIVIPAGTAFRAPPIASSRWGKDYQAVVGIDKDHTAYLTMNMAEALGADFVAHEEEVIA